MDSDTNILSWTTLDCGLAVSSGGVTDKVSPGDSEESLRADRRSISCCSAGLLLLSAEMFGTGDREDFSRGFLSLVSVPRNSPHSLVSDLAEDDKWVAANVARLVVGLVAPLIEPSDGGLEKVWPAEVRWLVARELRDKP